ncbi:unnamed protein product [Rotaria sordida]|uniref:BHLH domain-containing protein n=2 Tax=Rotaria sordida TaxID=392033 RepID=A0A815CMU1_9BILA|nr:unnamed protein product [Rotaria sordida]CAF1286431.1 unnamed protein product [Rotaria sordida]CAF1334353.1 unnamed protein product [Rotaria sordida]CAF1358557.1 unnamed protein product [Rotaria sordida]CAF1358778.1 unnamed protein product [Rotaria sordida]
MTRNSSSTKKTKTDLTKVELKKLKSILPTLKQKPTSTPIEIVLETIRYIRQLENQLIDRFQTDTSLSVPFTSRTSLSDMSTDSSLLQDISNTD